MKKIVLIILLIPVSLLMSFVMPESETLQVNSYTGVWQGQYGDKFFIFKTWESQGKIKGNYEIRTVLNGVPGNLIANSKKEYAPGKYLVEFAFLGSIGLKGLSGYIDDHTIPGTDDEKSGYLYMKIIPNNCMQCPVTASWKVTEVSGLKYHNPEFSIPTNLVLTKVSSFVIED